MPIKSTRMHGVDPRQHLDRASFMFAFAIGVFGGVFLKIVGAHPFVTALFSAAILIGYALMAWVGGRLKIESEAIGDNCYYLGFLFTLASLSFTLYQMAAPAVGGSAIEIPEVISGFGVALSSTIVGVFLRVFMMQMRTNFVAKDREVRADLNRSYGDFRKTLSGTLSQMKTFSTESVQYAAERDKKLRKSTEKFAEDHQKALQSAATSLSENMEKAFSGAAQKALGEISTSLQEANKASAAAIQEAHEFSAATMEEAHKASIAAMQDVVGELKSLKDRLAEQEAQSFEEIQSRRRRLIDEMNASEKRMKDHEVAMERYTKSAHKAADAMDRYPSPVADVAYPVTAPEDEGVDTVVDKPFSLRVKAPVDPKRTEN